MCCKRKEISKIKMKTPTTPRPKKIIRKSPLPQDDDTPIRAIACLNKIDDMRRFEESDDCFILGFDPSAASPVVVDSSVTNQHSDDISVIAEKGQVACRDYPHPRHLCLKFPFNTTPHFNYCVMCYCYVCDEVAPCKNWKSLHCNAESGIFWKNLRNLSKHQPQPLRLYNSQP